MKLYQHMSVTLLGLLLVWPGFGGAVVGGAAGTTAPAARAAQRAWPQLDLNGAASGLVADYQFRNNLTSAISGAPALTNLGSNSFDDAAVDDSPRRVLSFDPNNGLALTPTAGLITSQSYTVVLLVSFTATNGYRRLIDFKNGTSNRGLYVYFGRLIFLSSRLEEGGGVTITPNNFVQVAVTRNSAGTFTGYVNGVRQFSFTDTQGDAAIDVNQTLRFFRDNAGDGEASAGQVARLRLYNEALSGSQIAALDRLSNQQASCPSFSGFNPASGAPGASFLLNGSGLNGVTGVKFANDLAASFTVNDETQLSVTVPNGAATGTLTISKPGCNDVQTSAVFSVPNNNHAPLVADYQFQNSLRSQVGAPPALTSLGSNSFETVTVDNRQRRALRFNQNNGVALFSTAGLISNQAYTVVLLFALTQTNDYRRLIEFKNGTNNRGLYAYFDRLAFLTNRLVDGSNGVIRPNTYVQVALTRDSAGNVAGYVNGVRQFAFVDTEAAALIEGNALRFFRDNNGDGEASEGHVARIRLYNAALSDSEIAALDRLPTGAVASVSAASFDGATLALESIVAAFGAELATSTQVANTVPLPTALAGTTVRLRDSLGIERLASLFFVSPMQVNYQIPSGLIAGPALVTITSGNGVASVGTVQIQAVAPGLFSANANGRDVASGVVLRVRADGTQSFEPLGRFDSAQNRFVPVPIDLGPPADQVFLLLYGTGWRGRSSLAATMVRIGGVNAEVLYAGAAPGFIGLDQLNVRAPRELAGRGEVDIALTVDGRVANIVKLSLR
jgi:uncharacterized protein (TIGR03437 family)